jgi:oligoendopeptidase F
MIAERDPAAAGAWHTLFDQVTSTLRIPFEGEDRTIDEVLARVRGPVREQRLAAYEALFTALEPQAPILAHVYDSLVADRLVLDRVRGYSRPREPRDLDNEIPSAAVDVLLAAVERHHDLAHRWFRHKARLLGLEKLALGDQYAPLGSTRAVAYDDATALVEGALDDFSPRIGDVARGLYRDNRIDAEPRQGKRGGAFCASIAQDALPYIMLNFTDQMDDVRTLAHEIGHAMQFQLAGERQTALSHHPPLALAEVPSTFAEMIVTDRLLAAADDTQVRLGLLASSVETAFATVFRQTHMVRYEEAAYGLRAEGKALMPDRLSEVWLATNRPYYGDAVDLPEGYRFGWAYIPHFIHTRFYTYAYVFAHLASLALYAKYREDGDAFVGPYLDFLSIGGAASPQEQLAAIGLDISRDDVWDAGFAEIERLIGMAEAIEPE